MNNAMRRAKARSEVASYSVTVEEAYNAEKVILDYVEQINYSLGVLYRLIREFRDKEMYKVLGYSSFKEWYVDKRIPKTTVYRALSTTEFAEKYKLGEEALSVPQRKMDMLATLDKEGVINEDNVEEWVEKAKTEPENDFVKDYRAVRSGAVKKSIIPIGTYILQRVDNINESMAMDTYSDDIEELGNVTIYEKKKNGVSVYFVRIAPE